MRFATIVVAYDEGDTPTPPRIGDEVFGGRVTAAASSDAISMLEVAQEAMESGDIEEVEAGAQRLREMEGGR